MRILRLLRRRRSAHDDTPTVRIRLPRHGPAAPPTVSRPTAEPAPDGAEMAARDRLRAVLREVSTDGC